MANRLIPERRPHEARFLALSGVARAVYWPMLATLGASGIAIAHPATYTALTGFPLEQVESALAELEAAGWLRRQGAIMWLVDGLAEQGLNATNPNHRASVDAHLKTLEGLAPELVAEFRAHYAGWFATAGASKPGKAKRAPMPPGDHPDSMPDGIGDGIPDGIEMGSRSWEEGRLGGEEAGSGGPPASPTSEALDLSEGELRAPRRAQATAAALPVVSLAAAQPEQRNGTRPPASVIPVQLPDGVAALLRAHYGWDGEAPLTKRQGEVRRQLRHTLGERGARLEGEQYVRAVDRRHLSDVCESVAGESLTTPDGAIRIVLVRLRESYVEVRAARDRAAAAEDDVDRNQRLTEARAWAAAHPDAWETKRRAVEMHFPGAEKSAMGRLALAQALDAALLELYDEQLTTTAAAASG